MHFLSLAICFAFATPSAQNDKEHASDEENKMDPEVHFDANAQRAAPRDTFAVFDLPKMLSVEQAEEKDPIKDGDYVIGVHHGDEAKAYPLAVMGTAELGNDIIDSIPIAVSW